MTHVVPLQAGLARINPSQAAATPINRRQFLKASAILTGFLAAGTPLALLAPSPAWALPLAQLDQKEAEALMLLAKTLYPHEGLPDAVYALLVKDMDTLAQNAEHTAMIKAGLHRLLKTQWLNLSPDARTQFILTQQTDPFIEKVRAQCITSLYDNDMAFAHFGYEGESFSKGGYLYRGFNDLTWLPAPSEEASPAPAE